MSFLLFNHEVGGVRWTGAGDEYGDDWTGVAGDGDGLALGSLWGRPGGLRGGGLLFRGVGGLGAEPGNMMCFLFHRTKPCLACPSVFSSSPLG